MWIRQEMPKLKVKKHYGNPFLLTIAEFDEVTLTKKNKLQFLPVDLSPRRIVQILKRDNLSKA